MSQLSYLSQQRIFSFLSDVLLPFARLHFPRYGFPSENRPGADADIFLIKYEATGTISGLSLHEDGSHFTINIPMTAGTEFTGGGTFFPSRFVAPPEAACSELAVNHTVCMCGPDCSATAHPRFRTPCACALGTDCSKPRSQWVGCKCCNARAAPKSQGLIARPEQGTCLVHPGNLRHAGNTVTNGSRIILVAFFRSSDEDNFDDENYDDDARSAVESSTQIGSALKPSLVKPTPVNFQEEPPTCE